MPIRLFLLLLCFVLSKTAISQSLRKEADLKAVFIYNFTQYIEWDSSGITNEFVIGIIGNSEVSPALIEIAKTNKIRSRAIKVIKYDKPENIGRCQILFITNESTFSLQSILRNTEKGTLTISETTGYANMGSAINFVIRNDKLRFEANLKSLDMAGLKASSQLLKLAIIVNQ
jgi:hypothetical protein